VQLDWFTFTAQIVNFLILVVLLKRFLYRPIVQAMDQREQNIASELEEARQKKVEADQKESEYQKKLDQLEAQKEEWQREAKEEVEEQRKDMLKEAHSEIEMVRQRWKEALDSEKKAFLSELGKNTTEQIVDILKKILTDLSNRNLEKQTLEVFIEKVQHLDKMSIERLAESALHEGGETDRLKIRSTFELEESDRDRIVKVIQKEISDDVQCEFEEAPDLGFGIEIKTVGWKVGWNLNHYLELLSTRMEHFFDRGYLEKSVAAESGKPE